MAGVKIHHLLLMFGNTRFGSLAGFKRQGFKNQTQVTVRIADRKTSIEIISRKEQGLH
jgi:hypothetical protein